MCLEPKEEEDSLYVEPNIAETQQYFKPVMPPMEQGLSKQQVQWACKVVKKLGVDGLHINFKLILTVILLLWILCSLT